MSYDLYFTSPKITREQFYEYFRGRSNYKVESDQAVYGNEDTGVYFSFDFNEQQPSDENEIDHCVSFNINYYRPSTFGLEAEPEISSFIEKFSFEIYDYQNDGMGSGPYSREGFIKGWNHGNEFGYSSILQAENHPAQVYSRPFSELESIWQWNLNRNSIQEENPNDVFVPRIFYLTVDGKLGSVAVWPDGISTVIPKVDYLFIPRKELAPKKFFRRVEDKCLIPFEEAENVIRKYETSRYSRLAYELPSPSTPPEVKSFVASLSASNSTLVTIATDSLLDFELVEKYNVDSEIIT